MAEEQELAVWHEERSLEALPDPATDFMHHVPSPVAQQWEKVADRPDEGLF